MVEHLLRFSAKYFPWILAAVIIITGILGYSALHLEIIADVESLILNGDTPEGFSEKAFLNSDYLLIALSGENIYTPETMKEVGSLMDKIEDLEKIGQPITPFNQYTFEKSGKQLKIVQFSPGGRVPETEEDMRIFRERLLSDPAAPGLLVSRDGSVLSFLFPYSPMEDYSAFMEKLDPILFRMKKLVDVHVSGPIPFERAVKERLIGDFSRLVLLSLLVILLLLYSGFRSIGITLLPVATVVVGTVWTLGLMSLFHIPITIISIMTPPLVLTLGSSYTIHLLNQYFRDTHREEKPDAPIVESVFSIGRTIVLASLTTIIGFSSLLVTKLQQTRDFGIATSLGIASCAVLSVFVLPGLLSRIRRPSREQHDRTTEGRLVTLLDAAGTFARRRRRLIITAMILGLGLFAVSTRFIQYDSNYLGYFSKKEEVVQDFYFIADNLSGINQIQVILEAPPEEEGYFLKPGVLKSVVAFEDTLRAEPSINYLISFPSYIRHMNRRMYDTYEIPETRGLILLLSRYVTVLSRKDEEQSMIGVMANEDFTRIVCTFRTFDSKDGSFVSEKEMEAILRRAESSASHILPQDIKVSFAGGSLRYKALYEQTRTDQLASTLLALGLIFIVTSFFFRSLRYGVLTLLPMVTGITGMYIFMALTGIPLDMTTLMVASVAIGIGVDDSIHFLLQYRKQLDNRDGTGDPLRNTLHITGRPIVLTSTSIIGGILVLTLSSFKPILYFSLLVSFTLFATTLGCIFLLPAILTSLQKTDNLTL